MTPIFFQFLPQANTLSKSHYNKANTSKHSTAAHDSWRALQKRMFLRQRVMVMRRPVRILEDYGEGTEKGTLKPFV